MVAWKASDEFPWRLKQLFYSGIGGLAHLFCDAFSTYRVMEGDDMSRYRGGWSSEPPEPTRDEFPGPRGVPYEEGGTASPAGGSPSKQSLPPRGGGTTSRDGAFVGEVRGIDRNEEQGALNYQRKFLVLTFRVDCRD